MELEETILDYGLFAKSLEVVLKVFQSTSSTSLIIRGNAGSGKKSLLKVAKSRSDVITIELNPFHVSDDFMALRRIATKLRGKPKKSIQENVMEIEHQSANSDKRIIVILLDFDEFCRNNQTLLYNLTNLIQKDQNISMIGLTYNSDCTEHLEKRVRSRLNALFHEHDFPYSSKEEYVEFASLLLGGLKLEQALIAQLEHMYNFTNRSISSLKRYLSQISKLNRRGKLELIGVSDGDLLCVAENDVESFERRFANLNKEQQELLIMSLCYCREEAENVNVEFSLAELAEFARRHNHLKLDTSSERSIKNMEILASVGLLSWPKKMVDQQSKFTILVTPIQLRRVLEANLEYRAIKTEPLWRRLL